MASNVEVQVCRDGKVLLTRTVDGRPVVIGTAPSSDLVLEGTAWHRALMWNEDGTLWIKNLDHENPLILDGAALQKATVVPAETSVQLADSLALTVRPIVAPVAAVHPYRLTVDLQAITGPEAIIEDLETGRVCTIRSNNRVSVLYLLARELAENGEKPDKERGWCQDQEIACGVWGRNWQKQIKSHLHVLVHRIRKDIKAAGLDPWCIEKKRCHTRATVLEAMVK
jgi:hypothetical protein